MKVDKNRFIPFGGFIAINLFGILFVKNTDLIDDELLNHESIHTAQMRELGYIFFYLFYILEWLWRLMMPGNAYRNLSFEREAYSRQSDKNYLLSRTRFAQWRT